MPTSYSIRTPVSTSYSSTRIGGSYLVDNSGNYITDYLGNRIIVGVFGGDLPFNNTTYSTRPVI